jgi:phosphoribosyl 1,2-cyclic phosphodiesterase
MFFDSYQIPIGILECLSNRDIIQLSLVNKKIDCELADDRNKRRSRMIDLLLTTHYHADYGVFSIHYYYKTQIFSPHQISHRACFRMIVHFLPELFAFLEHHQARVLDFSAFSRISSDFFFSVEEQRDIIPILLHYIKQNRTFHYVCLTMFQKCIIWEQMEDAADGHPCLWVDKSSIAFYHHSIVRK